VDEERRPDTPDDDELFAGDSPRWRKSDVARESEAQRRRDDAPAPTSDSEGAIDRQDDPDDTTQSESTLASA
jgi:hypothetical protein